MTDAERGDLCDFIADVFGGYGSAGFVCDGATLDKGPPSRAACVQEVATWDCAATVAQLESCFTKLGGALAACDLDRYHAEGMTPDCAAYEPCIDP